MELRYSNFLTLSALLVSSIAAFVFLYQRSLKIAHSFIEFSLFRLRTFLCGSIIVLCAQFLLMNTVFWPIFFQQVLAYTPLQAGSYTIISTLPVMVISPISGYLSDKKGPRLPVTIGFISIIIACSLLSFYCLWEIESFLLWGVLVFGTGMAFIMTPTGTATLSYAPDGKRGLASGIYNTIRFTGASLGIATLGSAHEFVYSMEARKMSFYGFIADNMISIFIAIVGLVLTWFYLKAYNKKEILEV
jgi:MFS family permease